MIQIESIHIQELRGIRDLKLTMNRENFVVSGPNGSGKSGVVDAIQFALTGEIGRLKGSGTGDLTLSDHGPHVEKRSDPDAACVRLNVFIPHLKKSASIFRTIKKPKHPQITPNEDAVRAIFAEVAEHPEITLSRREIIKFILTEATQRSRDVQTLLKLDDIDQTRATLKTTENKLGTEHLNAKTQAESAEDSLKRHLDLPALKPEDLLAAVNKRRKLLGLQAIPELKKDTDVSEGLAEGGIQGKGEQSKESVLADLKALLEAAAKGLESPTKAAVASLLQNIATVEANPALLPLIKRHSFLQAGLDFVEGPQCPLCDLDWDIKALRSHLREKLAKSKEAQAVRDRLIESGRTVSAAVIRLRGLIDPLMRVPELTKEFSARLGQWYGGLLTFSESLASLEGVIAAKERLDSGWAAVPKALISGLEAAQKEVKARPDKSAAAEAGSFLVVAQERLNNLRMARRNAEEKKTNASLGKSAYKAYCDVSEAALTKLYQEVEQDFGAYYRLINHDDEGEFKAKFEATDGKLGLLVDFHTKGMFPPGAYHSEGHQDGMGVCLYLALMKRVLGKDFTIAVLDDVVMSVDSQHRKQFCKLLKTNFGNTQFVITTHDQVWARQLRSEGVVGAKAAVAFHTWTVETGPVLDEIAEVWVQIDADLAKNEVPTAAGRLRRHLEYVAAELADELGAKVKYRGDGGYDMGELLSAVIGRQGELLKLAAKAAKSWGDNEQWEKVGKLQKARDEILAASNGEQWVINKAIHYNDWADLSKNDFKPVVAAFKELLELFRCEKPKCGSWLSVTPRNDPVDLRCSCGTFRLNLKEK
jgi:energy-coupling factor transporter ATP-binding protein EcfA2